MRKALAQTSLKKDQNFFPLGMLTSEMHLA